MAMQLGLPLLLAAAGLPKPEEEHAFALPERNWRFDYAWPGLMLAAEVEGGTWMAGGGRHNRAAGYRDDIRKYNRAAQLGWTVLRFTTDMVASGEALAEIEAAIKAAGHKVRGEWQ